MRGRRAAHKLWYAHGFVQTTEFKPWERLATAPKKTDRVLADHVSGDFLMDFVNYVMAMP
ncbi:hypothetical protein CKO27_13410 [Thiocystis violacea]|nr:hypothetical protein [Thiocystis violacea]